MRCLLIALLFIIIPLASPAQTDLVSADAGISSYTHKPGFSVTTDRSVTKHIALGIGCQAYDYYPTVTNPKQYVPALFADLRLYTGKCKRFFTFLDPGINFYKATNYVYRESDREYRVVHNNGLHTSLGFGYFRPITKTGHGLYVTVKMISNTYGSNRYFYVTQVHDHAEWVDATFALSLGFRF